MSKCKTVQDEKKILELSVRQKNEGQLIVKKVVKAITVLEESIQEKSETQSQ